MNGTEKCPNCNEPMYAVKTERNNQGWLVAVIWECGKCKKRYSDFPTMHEIGTIEVRPTPEEYKEFHEKFGE